MRALAVRRGRGRTCYGHDVRFFSRIGSWLRTRSTTTTTVLPPPTAAAALDPEVLERLPRTPPEVFQRLLLETLEASRDRLQVVTLDPTMRMIAMSQRDLGDDVEIDNALRSVESGTAPMSSLTWSALRDARPPFSPAPSVWAGELAHLVDGDAGLIFFVDVDAIATAIAQAADQLGFATAIEEDGGVVRISDGRFCAVVGTSTVIAEALWTGCGPLTALMRRVRQVPNELRSFVSLLRGLERRFVGGRFEVVGDHLVVRAAGEASRRIDYRHLAAAARASGLAVDSFLRGASLIDIVERDDPVGDGDVVMLLRSPAWAKAWPERMGRPHDEGGVICLAREDQNGRITPIKRNDDDDEHRFAFLEREARRQLPFLNVAGHAFVVEQARSSPSAAARAFALVGDRAATLLLDAALVRGLCEQLGPVPDVVDVCTVTENVVIIAAVDCPAAVLEEARHRATRLEGDLFDDGADALDINQRMALPEHGAGIFELTLVPDEFFVLCDQADENGDLGRAHADYLRGLAYEALGLSDKAVRSFEKAVRARADDGELHLALGRALSAVGNHGRAVGVLQRAATTLHDNADLQNALGVALYKTGAGTDARAAFLKAVHLSPDDVAFLVNLARTCCDEQLFVEAKVVLEHALRMEPSSAEAHASMAVLLHRTGERSEALHHARAALAEHPDDDTVQELLRMIDDDDDDDSDDLPAA